MQKQDDTKIIVEWFHQQGKLLVEDIRKRLSKHKASGNLDRSVYYDVSVTRTGHINFVIKCDESVQFLIGGRKKGKMPRIAEVEKWMTTRGINPQGGKSKKDVAFAIAHKMKKTDRKGLRLRQPVSRLFNRKLEQQLPSIIAEAYQKQLLKTFTEGNEFITKK